MPERRPPWRLLAAAAGGFALGVLAQELARPSQAALARLDDRLTKIEGLVYNTAATQEARTH